MLQTDEVKNLLRCHLKELQEDYGVIEIGLFGSYVRGEQTIESDIDILVDFSRTPRFIEFLRLENHLSEIIGHRVDLVTRNALKPHIGKRILAETQYVRPT